MDGILFVKDHQNINRFVQIDLSIHGKLWEDFYDLIVAEARKEEENISYNQVRDELKKYGKL
jgi:hypothetical protein